MSIKLRWLGFVCFEMVLPSGKVLITDPYIDCSPTAPIKWPEVTGADYMAITHGHYDHITEVGVLARKFDSRVLCSNQVAEPLTDFFALDPSRVIRLTAGNQVEFEGLKIEVKRAEHISLILAMRALYTRLTGHEPGPDMPLRALMSAVDQHTSGKSPADEMRAKIRAAGIPGGEQLNFIFQTGDNLRIYVYSAGPDEHLRKEVKQAGANVFLVQLGGVRAEAAAETAALSGAEWVIPTHHDGEGIEVMHKRARKMGEYLAQKSKARFLDIEHGKWYEIGVGINEIK
jgi:L-ascorbate metabolism protein UlaG (beta-lactamase superfamily)